MGLIPRISFQTLSAEREQEWNRRILATPVDVPTVGVWRYTSPAVVQGCSQSFIANDRANIPSIKRAAGGGAVLVGPWMLSISVALPGDHPLVACGLVESYKWLGELIAHELVRIGIGAHAVTPAQTAEWNEAEGELGWACFGGLSPWEVVTQDGRKIAGLAQRRCRNGVLFVAGILVDCCDWPLLCTALNQDPADAQWLAKRTVSCSEILDRPVSSFDLGVMLDRALIKKLLYREAVTAPCHEGADSSASVWQKMPATV